MARIDYRTDGHRGCKNEAVCIDGIVIVLPW